MANDKSMRALFSRRGVTGDEISLRNALANHIGGSAIGLRAAERTFTTRDRGNGRAAGCRLEDSSTIDFPGIYTHGVGNVLPAWVDVERREHAARTIEGILRKAKITDKDFPLKPWHASLDWNFLVQVDSQYAYLVSEAASAENSTKFAEHYPDVIECEWESACLPLWAVPQEESRIWMMGRWIYDCGHPEPSGYRTEIHPPKAVVSFRREAGVLPGNTAPTPVTRAALYIRRHGGYIDQEINRTYAFDLHLPPKPHADAEPRFLVSPQTNTFPVEPTITPFPTDRPRLLRVVVPLDRVARLDEYGAVILGGWSDPDGTAASGVHRVRISIDRVTRTKTEAGDTPATAPTDSSVRTWHLHLGINARWLVLSLDSLRTSVNKSVELMLSSDDAIQISAFGIEHRNIFEFVGADTGLNRLITSERRNHDERIEALKKIAAAFRNHSLLHGPPLTEGNMPLGIFSKLHAARERGPFSEDSSKQGNAGTFENTHRHNNYIVEYRIEDA